MLQASGTHCWRQRTMCVHPVERMAYHQTPVLHRTCSCARLSATFTMRVATPRSKRRPHLLSLRLIYKSIVLLNLYNNVYLINLMIVHQSFRWCNICIAASSEKLMVLTEFLWLYYLCMVEVNNIGFFCKVNTYFYLMAGETRDPEQCAQQCTTATDHLQTHAAEAVLQASRTSLLPPGKSPLPSSELRVPSQDSL